VPIKTKELGSNWELSSARALAVIKLLLEKGVRPDVLSAAGYAEFDPAQSNTSDKGRAKNRRIEIVIVPNIEDLVKMPELGKAKEGVPPLPKPKEPTPPAKK
jgi:chemotaxis protein MotB